ncbi:AraC family transcriptional regulator [Parabacteroides sp. AM08-6]|uniref:helix-turn-helix domain-containing protein n=1 Tax=Parabacteroides sp. AM08-6 TaxID=2292053 RepID=UPI000F009E47|nr:AraC family transcriptional regulator [Parabacteroides sp. AM08-6]RHJ87900.1 AraC family transcriptional regulator [Parabacteroides sp. AM08-6]
MGKNILNLETVHQCNCFLGEKTFHPLVSIIDLSKAGWQQQRHLKLGFYAVLLEEHTCDCFLHGRKDYDFSDGTLLFLSPGETIEIGEKHEMFNIKGWLLTFHPEFIINTPLGQNIGQYTFFYYRKEEALHISLREKRIICQSFENISDELHHSIDEYSKTLISKQIELLLDYCTRFYTRQFITRCEANKKIIEKTGCIADRFFIANQTCLTGLPTTKQCAHQLQLSPAYLENLFKHETGKTIYEYMQFKRIEIARKWLRETDKTIGMIAKELGFSSTQYFSSLFKRITGSSPCEYRLYQKINVSL